MISKWHKIDLHIHTDKSKQTKENDYNGIFDTEVLKKKLIENHVEMISLTDHNTINCQVYKAFLSQTDISILVGVELDIALSEDILKEYIESIDKCCNDKIDIKPYHVIVIFRSFDYDNLNTLLEKMYSRISEEVFNNAIDLNKKIKLRVTTFKYLMETFTDEDYFLIAHGDKDKGIVPAHKKTDTIKDAQFNILLGEISALEMKSSIKRSNAIEMYNKGFNSCLAKRFQGKTTSYVIFSDNHDCSNYTFNELCTWVKGGLNYETLRLSFSDPESRILTDVTPPTHSTFYIDEFNINQKDIGNSKITFSPYLNVIIGGRSSGKSLLFNTLISMNAGIPTEDKLLFKSIYSKIVKPDDIQIRTNDCDLCKEINIPGEAYCQEKIIDLFKDDADLRSRLVDCFPTFNETEVAEQELIVEDIFTELSSSYKDFYEFQDKIKKKDKSSVINNSTKDIKKIFNINISKIVCKHTPDEYSKIIEKLNGYLDTLKELKNLLFKNEPVFSIEEQETIQKTIDLTNSKLGAYQKSKALSIFKTDFFSRVKTIYDQYIKKELTQEHQLIENSKTMLIDDIKDYKEYFKRKLKLRKACNIVENFEVKIDDKKNENEKYVFVSKLNFEITKSKIVDCLFEDSFLNYNKNISIYENLLKIANPELFDFRIKHKTGLEGKNPLLIDSKIKTFISSNKSKKQFEIIEKGSSPISTANTSQGRKASIFLDLKMNSFMAGSNKSLLMVDQIEDNIDNKYISDNLVNLLRRLKNNMQIIIVTHNPSIAIYGDAENIVICENIDGVFHFRQGGLEDISIRNEACSILDGGEVAFKNRMDKYNIEKQVFAESEVI